MFSPGVTWCAMRGEGMCVCVGGGERGMSGTKRGVPPQRWRRGDLKGEEKRPGIGKNSE